MIKLITALLITLSPSNAEAKGWECTGECIGYQMNGMGACAQIAQIFTPGGKDFNNAWYACLFKLQQTEKYKQCQKICEPKENNETTAR